MLVSSGNSENHLKGKTIQPKSRRKPSRAPVLFLHIIIVILSVLVVFLSYQLITKLNLFSQNREVNESIAKNKIIHVEILNGCGVPEIADKITGKLRGEKFDVVNTGNYRSFDVDETIIIDRIGDLQNALMLADSVGIDPDMVISQVNKNYFLDITMIIGKDYKIFFN